MGSASHSPNQILDETVQSLIQIRWYSKKFLKGQWDKEDYNSEWQKYRECLSQHLDDKHLSRFLEADTIIDSLRR